jgi:hypothetical protein
MMTLDTLRRLAADPATATLTHAQLAALAAAWRKPVPTVRETETAASLATLGPLFAGIARVGR